MFKELYNKTIKLAGHKRSKSILGFISFIESFIFPIPPDVLIIPMTIARKHEWIRIALIATIGSILGACLGYFIGYVFFNEIGLKIFEIYGVDDASFLKDKVSSEGGVIAWITLLAIAGFSPVPFKLLTITSGFINFNILYFIIISLVTRGSRFFLIAFLIEWNVFSHVKQLLVSFKDVKRILSFFCSLYLIKNNSTKLFIFCVLINFWWAKRESNSHSIGTIGF